VLLLAAAATPAAATSYYGAYSSRHLSSVSGAYYGAYGNRRLTDAPVPPPLLPATRRLFGAWEPHSVPVPARLAAASRALTGYGYYAVSRTHHRASGPFCAPGRTSQVQRYAFNF